MKNVVPLYPVDPPLLQVGTRLNGIFEIQELIGEGGMAQVYRARMPEADESVAIKVIKPEITRDPSMVGLLKKEAQTLGKIAHEAVVRHLLFSIDPEVGHPYIAMELVEGPSLADLLRNGPVSVETVVVLLNRIGAGLGVAHRLGITHRDISPDNIILPDADPARAKLIDFGIARNLNANETIIADRFAGKLNYASPEHLGLHGGSVTPKSDVYGFGLTLVAALNGAPLDRGRTQVEIIRARQTVPDLGRIDPRVRPILARMLQPDPADRPDAADLTAGEGASAVRARGARPTPGARRRGLVAAAGLLLLAAGGGVGWYGLTRDAGPEPAPAARDRPAAQESRQAARSGEAAASRTEEPPAPPRRETPREPAALVPPPPAPETGARAPEVPEAPPAPDGAAEAPPTPAPAARTGPDRPPGSTRNRLDCSTCPFLVEIPGGTFGMGGGGDPSEKPVHPVRIRPFLLSRGPVTVGEWNACYADGTCEFRAEGASDQPAANLSWDDAQQYVRWISGVTRKAYRLPSEAEWEYAARGGTRTRFWWGDAFQSGKAPCRSAGSPPRDGAPAVTDAPENPFGLVGTVCVVAQWVSDCWHRNYRGAPGDGSAWTAPNCRQRVLRGGTWRSQAESERMTSRDVYDPSVRYPSNGVRVARDL